MCRRRCTWWRGSTWALRGEGVAPDEAARRLAGMSIGERHDLLYRRGGNFNELPPWQRRGVGLYWDTYAQPVTGMSRIRVVVDLELAMKDAYAAFIAERIERADDQA